MRVPHIKDTGTQWVKINKAINHSEYLIQSTSSKNKIAFDSLKNFVG